MDCETTGLAINRDDPSYDPENDIEYQSVSWGLIVADAATLDPLHPTNHPAGHPVQMHQRPLSNDRGVVLPGARRK